MELRPLLVIERLRRKRLGVAEQVFDAHVREFSSTREAVQLASTGQYAPGGRLAFAGSVVISCHTPRGVLEFAVRRPDVPLVLERLAGRG